MELAKLRIDHLLVNKKVLWTAVIVLTGGLVTISLNVDSILKLLLLIFGILSDYILFTTIIETNKNIEKLLKTIEDED